MTLSCWVCKALIEEDDFRMRCVKCEMHMCEGCASDENRWCFKTSACVFAKKKEAPVMTEVSSTGKCAVCKSKILENPVSCPKCDTAHCESCWGGKCSVYGCSITAQAPVVAIPPPIVQKSACLAISIVLASLLATFGSILVMVQAIDSCTDIIKIQRDEVVINELDGRMMVMEPGHEYIYYRDGAKLTHYKWRKRIQFSVPATLRYGQKVIVSGSVGYDLSVNEDQILNFHIVSRVFNNDLVSIMITNTINFVSPQTSTRDNLPEIIRRDLARVIKVYGIDLYNWNMDIRTDPEAERERLARYHVRPSFADNEDREFSNAHAPVSRQPNFARCHKYGGCPPSALCSFTLNSGCGK